MHALRAALNQPLGAILRTYQESDNCIPLTAFYKLWGLAGGALTESLLRAPIVLSGLALLWLLPRVLAPRLPACVLAIYAWLLALSPLLIAYSRIARSYLPLVLFALLAVLAFERYWHEGGRGAAVTYVVCGALAVWFHLGAATFVAAPGLYALGDLALARDERALKRKKLLRLVGLGTAMAVACALFLVPAWDSLSTLVAGKRQAQQVPWGVVLPEVFRLYAGTANRAVALAAGLAALAGFVLLFRRDRRLALFTGTLAAGHAAGLLLLSPLGLASPLILGRYLLPILPLLLLWLAGGLGLGLSGDEAERRGSARLRLGLAGAFLVFLVYFGPLADGDLLRGSFVHHNDFVRFVRPRTRLTAAEAPEIYRRLAAEPGGGAIVEYPWLAVWEANRSFYAYQAIHRRRVIAGTPQRLLFRPPAALRNAVPPDPAALCRSGAAWLLVHQNIDREEDRIARREREPVVSHRLRQQLRDMASGLTGRLRAGWGEPDYADRWIAAWDLRKACGGRGPGAGAPRPGPTPQPPGR